MCFAVDHSVLQLMSLKHQDVWYLISAIWDVYFATVIFTRLAPQVYGRLRAPVQGQANGKVKADGIDSLSYRAEANAHPTCVFERIVSMIA